MKPFEYYWDTYCPEGFCTEESWYKIVKDGWGGEKWINATDAEIEAEMAKHPCHPTWEEIKKYQVSFFKIADLDKDGKLDQMEAKGLYDYSHRPKHDWKGEEDDLEGYSREAFDYCDYNKNGFLCKMEATACMLKHEFDFRAIDT